MKVLHMNKDSLMAVLEAFVYDPLLNWRLMETNTTVSKAKRAQAGSGQESGDLSESVPNLSNKPCSLENTGIMKYQ